MAQLPPEQKNLISHRAQAMHAFLPLLRAHLAAAADAKPDSPEV
jgi:hypothetical protein